ncbi:MAG: hypothetical protein ACLP3R_26970 [Candidatus Korobacteraceae bacterium]
MTEMCPLVTESEACAPSAISLASERVREALRCLGVTREEPTWDDVADSYRTLSQKWLYGQRSPEESVQLIIAYAAYRFLESALQPALRDGQRVLELAGEP